MMCVFVLCGCAKEETVPVNADFGGTFKLYIYEDDTFNPLKTKYQTNAQTLSAVMHKGLVKVNQKHEIACDLAESYSFSEDKMQLVFKLGDVTFSDGSKVTAKDVVNSLDIIRQNKENMFHVIFNFISGYSGEGNTVTLNLYKPNSGVLCYMNFPVLKEENGIVTGAGLYKLPEGKSISETLLAADSLKTNFSSVKLMMCSKETMAENSFLNDEVDVINADYSSLARLQGKMGINTTEYISDSFTFLGINNQNEVLGDVNVRKAIASLINKNELTETLMAGCAKAVNSPFKPGTIYGELYPGEYSDRSMFEKYLENTEYTPGGLMFNILVNEDSITKTKTAQYICKMFEDAGMSAVVEAVDFDTYIQRINDGEFSLFVGETTVSLDQDFSFLAESGKNIVGYSNPEMDELLSSFRAETEVAKRQQIVTDIAKKFVDELPVISLYYMKNTLLTDADIEGDFAPMQTNLLGDLSALKIKK